MVLRKRRIDDEDENAAGNNSNSNNNQASADIAAMSSPPESPLPFSDANDEDNDRLEDTADRLNGEEEEEGEDLFNEALFNDYKEVPHLDAYDMAQLDEDEYEEMDRTERMKVEAELRKRDVREGRLPPTAFLDQDENVYERGAAAIPFITSDMDGLGEEEIEEMAAEALIDADTNKYSLLEIVTMERYRRLIARDYRTFLATCLDENGSSIYNAKIRNMCSANLESLEVSYIHLASFNAFLAKLVANVPSETLTIFDEASMLAVLEQFPDYTQIQSEIHVRITDLPTADKLSDLRNNHLNTLIKVSGVVTRRTGVFPQMKLVKYDCVKCGAVLGPFTQDLNQEIKIGNCPMCESKGPFSVNAAKTVYRNYQKVTLQESPGSVPAGRLPRHKEVILLWDLIDFARPGEEIEVTGIYRNNFSNSLNTKHGFPVFSTIIEANFISKKEDQFASFRLTEDDQRDIRRLAQNERIGKMLIKSIAPSIYGHENIKTALALAMFGGQPKNIQGKHQVRGDINVLLLGDPGTAKSQFLKYVEKTAHRAVYTTGQGASAVGLTASVHKDPVTREWTLEGGALVLADKGICLIDEFDKMNDADRTSIHEAMEQQSISVSKAGIVTTLQARCSVIAAANPIRGRYNPSIAFSQNVELTEPILSRFDVLCVVRDTIDPVKDEQMAKFIVSSHIKSHPLFNVEENNWLVQLRGARENFDESDIIPQDLLKKYIMFAKSRVKPVLSEVDVNKISRLYADLRKESLANGGIPITVRHIESIVRMAEAHARMHLRDSVRSDDVDLAIRVMLESFISSQKFSVTKQLKKAFAKYITYKRDHFELLLFILQELLRDVMKYYHYRFGAENIPQTAEIEVEDFEMKAKELGIHDLRPFYESNILRNNGFRINSEKNMIEKNVSV